MTKRHITFFVVVVFALLFLPATVSAQMPDRTPEKFSTVEWATYSRSQLLKVDPEDALLINRMRIVVTKNIMVNAKNYWWMHPSVLVIHYGLILSVDNEEQYDSVLLHELGHLKLQQFPPIIIDDDGEEQIDLGLFLKGERDADIFSQHKMVDSGHDGCAAYLIAKKTFDFSNPHDPRSPVDFMRLRLMLTDCKRDIPHVPGKPSPGPQ